MNDCQRRQERGVECFLSYGNLNIEIKIFFTINIKSSFVFDSGESISRDAGIQATVLGTCRCDVQVAYHVARLIDILADGVSVNERRISIIEFSKECIDIGEGE